MTRYGWRLVLPRSRRVQPLRGDFATVAEARAAGQAAAALQGYGPEVVRVGSL